MARHEQLYVNELTINKLLNPYGQIITPGANPTGALDYFVDLNRVSAGNGLTWDTAFTTIAAAITASNASIGLSANRWWARRNRIFVVGDGISEDLTVLPEKTDIIGMGADLYPFPRVTGHHTIASAVVACRFINMGFQGDGNNDLFDLPAGMHGLGFLGCTFTPALAGNTKGLEIDDAAHVRIIDCDFLVGAGGPSYFAVCVDFEGTVHHDCVVKGGRWNGTAGLTVSDSGANCFGSIIQDCVLRTTALAINDDSDDWQVVNNRWMTDINTSTSTAGYDFNLQLAAGNIQMGATGLCDTIPFTKIAE